MVDRNVSAIEPEVVVAKIPPEQIEVVVALVAGAETT